MRPLRAKLADQHYVVGEQYMLEPILERSMASHRHYFAVVRDAWRNLREEDAERFLTDDALRYYALIRTGWRDERSLVLSSNAEALRVAAFMRPANPYAVILVREKVVVEYVAKTQSIKGMGKDDFNKSKTDVLDFLAAMLGTTTQALAQNAETVA